MPPAPLSMVSIYHNCTKKFAIIDQTVSLPPEHVSAPGQEETSIRDVHIE
jgi:hypothetical protein